MSTQVQIRRGNTIQTAAFTGAIAELTVDTDKKTLVVHDGSTAGGTPLAKESSLSANAIFSQAAFNQANTSFITATSAGIYANGAFAAANNAAGVDLTQNNSITAAFTQANTGVNNALSASNYANGAFTTANSATNTATAAYTRANNSVNANTGGTITGDLVVTGNLTISGQTTYSNTVQLLVGDNLITLNAELPTSVTPVENAGIEINRGNTFANASLLWVESAGKWQANTGSATGAYFLANEAAATSAGIYANGAFIQANSAYVRANNSLNANTGGTIAGPIVVDAGTYGNVTTTQFASVYGQAYGPNAYSIMQVRSSDFATGMGIQVYAGLNGLLYSNTGIQFNTGSNVRDKDYPTGGTNAGQFAANGAFIAQASLASTSNTTGSIQVAGGVGIKGNVAADGIIFPDGTRQTSAGAGIGDALALSIALG
jgi:hypothetical protein